MIRFVLLAAIASPALAAQPGGDGLPPMVSAIAPLLVGGLGLWLARRAMRARARRAKD